MRLQTCFRQLTISFIDRYTSKSQDVYAIVLEWPTTGILELDAPVSHPDKTEITMLGLDMNIKWRSKGEKGMVIEMPVVSVNEIPSQWAWVLKVA